MSSHPFFTRKAVVIVLATLCCLLWGSAYPAIKTGYLLFAIATGDIASKVVFAGWRFLFAGLLLLALAAAWRRPVLALKGRDVRDLTILGLTQTTTQYIFFYVGLAHTTGVKGAILNATGTFFSVLLAHLIYHNDRLSPARIAACVIGFAGVMVVNFEPGLFGFDFTVLGEGFVVLAALVLSAATIFGKRISQRMDSLVMTAHQLTIGGLALLAAGYGFGGVLEGFTLPASALLAYLALLSAVSFALWSVLLKYNRVGVVSVFTFLIPVFGSVLSAVFLHEQILRWKNMIALVLVSTGIWLVARERR